jgi:peptidyl-tRNA hydrolase, PTH1 family
MKLIIGLGNPGKEYEKTRHNVGFILLDKYVDGLGLKWEEHKDLKALICKKGEYLFVKPTTFMNKSGQALTLVANYFKLSNNDIMVIHDEVDLPFGEIKRQLGSGAAGHHGVESIISELGTKEIWRLRFGIGRGKDGIEMEDYVLQSFTKEELAEVALVNLEPLLI